MTDKDVKDFIWDWKRDWFNTDQFVQRFTWKKWSLVEFEASARRQGFWTDGIAKALGVKEN